MSGVFREVVMTYNGEDYSFVPSNRVLRGIERELSLTEMVSRIGTSKPPVSEMAFVAAEFLRAAGADKVDEDEMYGELMSSVLSDGKMFTGVCEAIVMAISPSDDIAKKPQAPKKAGPGRKKKPRA